MKITWNNAFSKQQHFSGQDANHLSSPIQISTIEELIRFLDIVQIRQCLLKPYFESPSYPLVESRELLPSFETDTFEYKDLPGFSMVALQRPLNYFNEIFQFDILHTLLDQTDKAEGGACPLEQTVLSQNLQTLLNRLPKQDQESLKTQFLHKDVSDLEHYPELLPFLLEMDRAHVLAQDSFGNFYLSGVYASFPSDLDAEIKRFGLRTGKFTVGDNARYELNRSFIYQFLMELYGFPIVSERRTSSALFARRLHKIGENFMIRVLGQSDRCLTTLYRHPENKAYPRVEKIALVRVDEDQKDVIQQLKAGGYFVDTKKRVVILRVIYRQHKYNPDNVRQDRALSVLGQEIIHPLTAKPLTTLNIIKDVSNMFLRLNDIVRGEFTGRTIYKRHEIVENTDTDEKRLKVLYSWLSKHQRRIIGYSDEFYANVVVVLDNYLLNPDAYETFQDMYELYQEVWSKYSYIQQARKVRFLEDIIAGQRKDKRFNYLEKLTLAADLLNELKFEIVNYFEELVLNVILLGERLLNDSYLKRNYTRKKDEELSEYGLEIKRKYGKVVALLDEFKSIRKTRSESLDEPLLQAG